MEGYASGPRPLPWPLLYPLVDTLTVEDDGDFPPSSFVWPEDPDERTMIPFWLSLNEYNILGSTIDVGSDVAFAEDALRVVWLWMRNFRIEVPMLCCDELTQALIDQDTTNATNQAIQRAIQSQALRDALELEYTGDPTSINPNAPTDDFGSTGDRYDALCAGLMAFVYQFARAQSDSARAGQAVSLAAIALMAGLLIPGLNIFFLVGASIAVVLGLGTIGVTVEVAITALTDQDALNDVVCCMRDNLKDLEVTEANWLTALGGCGFGSGSNAQIVADFIGASLADNYLTILNILGQAYTGVIDDEPLPECPDCGEPPPDPNCMDLTEDPYDWFASLGRAVYHSGQGWGPYVEPGLVLFRLTRPSEDVSRYISEVRVYFLEPQTDFSIFIGAAEYAYSGSPVTEVILNETTFPDAFPFSTGAPNSITIKGNGPIDGITSASQRLIMVCLVPA